MKELGNKLRALRGRLTLEEAVQATGLSRETLRRLEAGKQIRLKSLKRIARGLQASEADELELICTWLRAHAGAEAARLRIEPRGGNISSLQTVGEDLDKRILGKCAGLTTREKHHILLAMDRPEVLRSMMHLNQLYDDIRRPEVREPPEVTKPKPKRR